MTDNFAAEIDALMAELDEEGGAGSRTPSRIVVATDWESAALPLTVLKAFVGIVPPGGRVELVFAVPDEPTENDATCVAVLAQGASLAEIPEAVQLRSFESVVQEPFDCAVVPTGSTEELLAEVGGVITRMHDLVRSEGYSSDDTVNPGNRDALSRRLAAFAG